MLWAGGDVAQNIFHKLPVFCDKGAYRCHTGCFGLTVVRNMNGIDSLGHVGIMGEYYNSNVDWIHVIPITSVEGTCEHS